MLPFASHAAASRDGQLVCAEPPRRAGNGLKGGDSPEGCETGCCGSTGGGPADADPPLRWEAAAPPPLAPKLPRAPAGAAAAEAPPDSAAAGIGCAAAAAGAAAADAPGAGCEAAARTLPLPPPPPPARTRTVSDSPLRSGSAATVAPSPRPSSCRGGRQQCHCTLPQCGGSAASAGGFDAVWQ